MATPTEHKTGRNIGVVGLVLVAPVYILIVTGLMRFVPPLFGWEAVSFDKFGSTLDTLYQNVSIPLAIMAALVVGLVLFLGWGPRVFKDEVPTKRWLIAIPIVLSLVMIGTIDWSNLTSKGGTYIAVLAVTTLLVGVSEETTYRGLLVVGIRRLGQSEKAVWFWSTLAFALMHLGNVLIGSGVSVVPQTLLAFLSGTLFYLSRRATGSLAVAIVVHGIYDFAVFSHDGSTSTFTAIGSGLGTGIVVVLFIVVLIAHKAWMSGSVSAPPADAPA
jgi:membrane protease YdiL (CAAX protease family)